MEYERIFIDADAFISLNSKADTNHKKAVKVKTLLENGAFDLFTSTYTLLEVATVLNMKTDQGLGSTVATLILTDPFINIISGDEYLLEGIKIMKQQKSKNISLNDCVYFAISKNFEIKKAFSFDKHWAKNGFTLL